MTDDPVRQPDGPLEHQATAKRQKVRSDPQLFPDQAQPTLSQHHQMQNLMNRSQSYQLQDSVGWSFEQQFQPNPSHMGHLNQNQNPEYMFGLFPPNLQGTAFLPQTQAQPHLQQSMIPTTQPPYAPSPRQHPPLSHSSGSIFTHLELWAKSQLQLRSSAGSVSSVAEMSLWTSMSSRPHPGLPSEFGPQERVDSPVSLSIRMTSG
jgi:hypothetical protein